MPLSDSSLQPLLCVGEKIKYCISASYAWAKVQLRCLFFFFCVCESSQYALAVTQENLMKSCFLWSVFVLIILLHICCWNHLHLVVKVNCWISLLLKLWVMQNSEWLRLGAGLSLWENGLRISICFSGVHGQSIFATSFTMQWVSLYFRI